MTKSGDDGDAERAIWFPRYSRVMEGELKSEKMLVVNEWMQRPPRPVIQEREFKTTTCAIRVSSSSSSSSGSRVLVSLPSVVSNATRSTGYIVLEAIKDEPAGQGGEGGDGVGAWQEAVVTMRRRVGPTNLLARSLVGRQAGLPRLRTPSWRRTVRPGSRQC
jgi:hypothetical protein